MSETTIPALRPVEPGDEAPTFEPYIALERAIATGRDWSGQSGIDNGGETHLKARAFAQYIANGPNPLPFHLSASLGIDPWLIAGLLCSGLMSFGDPSTTDPANGELGDARGFNMAVGNAGCWAYRNMTWDQWIAQQRKVKGGGGKPSGG